jgi:hypothetical protein
LVLQNADEVRWIQACPKSDACPMAACRSSNTGARRKTRSWVALPVPLRIDTEAA